MRVYHFALKEGARDPAQIGQGDQAVELGLGKEVERSEAEAGAEGADLDPEAGLGALGGDAKGEVAARGAGQEAADNRVA